MNIDTLKRPDGTYRRATVSDIKRMLSSEHVCHIQSERGTIAIRPGQRLLVPKPNRQLLAPTTERGWEVDRVSSSHDRAQSKWFRRGEQQRLIRAVLVFLNGSLHHFEAGHDVTVYANQADRDAYVLAVKGQQVLIEYEMPGGTSALVLMSATGDQLTRIKTFPHRALPQHWINAIHEQGYAHLWIGRGQRTDGEIALPPAA